MKSSHDRGADPTIAMSGYVIQPDPVGRVSVVAGFGHRLDMNELDTSARG